MAEAGQRIDSPTAGLTFTFEQTGAESGGALLALRAELAPGSSVVPHRHLLQEERFQVLEGQARFTVRREVTVLGPGEQLAVAPGKAHSFRNETDRPVRLRVEFRPALRTAELFEALFALDRAGQVNRFGAPGPRRTARLAREHGDGFFWLAGLPVGLQRTLFQLLR